jgi:hypothetical protein
VLPSAFNNYYRIIEVLMHFFLFIFFLLKSIQKHNAEKVIAPKHTPAVPYVDMALSRAFIITILKENVR